MVAKLLEDVDRLEWLRSRSLEELLDLGGFDEILVERKLERGQAAEDDGFVLDGD